MNKTNPSRPNKTTLRAEVKKAAVEFTFPVRIYCRRGVAWDDPNPARGYKGLVTRPMTLTNKNTVIACMHPGNYCYEGGVEWGPGKPYAWWTKNMEALPRTRRIIDKRIAPLFKKARSAGVQIIYLLQGWSCAHKYPQYREILERAKDKEPPAGLVPRSPDEKWKMKFEEEVYGPEWVNADRKALADVMDVAPPIKPEPRDWVIATTAQASTLLSENGIWNIMYTGFDTNGCVMWSEGGMWKMGKLGYRRILLRDCTTGMETAESFPENAMTRASIAMIETGMAYTADSRAVIAALDRAKG